MGTFDIRPDAPGLLRSESLNTTIKFDRTGPTTGRISWNIPTPAAGCTADTQAYCGMLVTIDSTPASSSKLPANNTVYSSDPTADANLFAGDRIGTAMVVGAFYQDRTTTFMDVSGLKQNAPYYVSGFPVDCEFRYFKEGIHAYSLDIQKEDSDLHKDTNGSQVVQFSHILHSTDVTGLVSGVDYDFDLQLGTVPRPQGPTTNLQCIPQTLTYTLTIPGSNAGTYGALVDEINTQISLVDHPPMGPQPPNTNAYFYNISAKKLFIWDGYQHVEQTHIRLGTDPALVSPGTYWFNPTTEALNMHNGTAWVPLTYITYETDPTTPACDTIWFDGTNAYEWSGVNWRGCTTYVQIDNPSFVVPPVCGSYWFDTLNSTLSAWDDGLDLWTVTTAVQYPLPPNALPIESYWMNESNSMLYSWTGAAWSPQPNVAVSEHPPTTPAPGKFWYNPSTMELFQRNTTNTTWVQLDVIVFLTDPTDVSGCDLWWDMTTNTLKTWDTINNVWVAVAAFFEQETDPTDPPPMMNGSVWYDPSTNTLSVWQDVCFKVVPFISWPTDPTTTLTTGTAWLQPSTNILRIYDRLTNTWTVVIPVINATDPTLLPSGTYWFNTSNSSLSQRNGGVWVSLVYSTYPLTPTKDSVWFDLSTNTLMQWNGDTWVVATPRATATINCNGNLEITDNNPGSLSLVQITDGTLFAALGSDIIILSPVPGTDGVSRESSYNELGIGTDGSADERRKLMNEIRYEMGYPVVDVELTPEQIDYAITKALEELRSRTGVAYRRGFFFMNIQSETQRYLLTNKIQGMNKIVTVLGVYRLTSSFLSSAHGAGVYGQIVIQHLYNMGTFDLLSFHLMAEYTELMEMLFAGRITFTWNEDRRELWIHQRFPFHERMVLIEAAVERTEQEIITDRWCRPWIRKFAAAQARLMLAESRGKYASLPGAGGGVSLNASDLRTQATADIEACLADIDNYVVERPEEYGIGAQFVLG